MARNKRRRGLRRWHGWLGIALLPPLLVLVATGILLNHSDRLALDQRYAGTSWLVPLYGISAEPPSHGYAVGEHWISRARDRLFLDARPIGPAPRPLLGATRLDGRLLAVATGEGLSLYLDDGRPVDELPLPASHQPAERFLRTARGPALASADGFHVLNEGMTAWVRRPALSGQETTARPLPRALRDRIADRLAANTLSWERILLDLHGGRLFGALGPWLMDLAALAMAILATTGCIMWWRVTRTGNRRHRGR